MNLLGLFNSREQSNRSHLKNLISVAMADGKMDDNEVKVLLSIANRLGINETNIRQIIINHKNIKFILPKERKECIQQFWDLIIIILTDGKIEEHEMIIFEKFATNIGIRKAIISGLVRKFVEWIDKKEPLDTFKGEFIAILTDKSSWE